MKHLKWLAFFIFISALFFAYKYFAKQPNNPHFQQLDAYSQAFKLKQLRSSNQNELRLWFFEPMEGGISSLIFTVNGVSECEGTSQYGSNTEIIVKSSSCRKSKVKISKSSLESMLVQYRELTKLKTSCDDVNDGWGMTIDAVLNNERFAFQAWNPDACEDPGAKKLTELLMSLNDK
jgi:hypothetical protein